MNKDDTDSFWFDPNFFLIRSSHSYSGLDYQVSDYLVDPLFFIGTFNLGFFFVFVSVRIRNV